MKRNIGSFTLAAFAGATALAVTAPVAQAAEEGGLKLLSFSTLLGEMLTFAVLVFVMMKFVWPPLMNAIETRQKEIADGLAAGEQGRQELADAAKEKSALLEEARTKANEMVEDGEKRKNAIVDGAKREAETERERILEQGRREVESERLAMRQELEQKLGDLVITGTSHILQREVDGAAHRDIIDSLKKTL